MKLINGIIKWVLVIAAGLSAALLSIIFLSNKPAFDNFLLRLVILIAVGFLGGLAGRIFFRKVPAVVTLFLVTLASVISLLLIDFFYETPYKFAFMTSDLQFSAPSVSDGGQVLFFTLVSLMPIFFMRRKKNDTVEKPARKPAKKRKPLSESIKPALYQINPVNWQVFKPKTKSKRKKSKSSKSAKARSRASAAPTLTIPRPVKTTTKIKSGNGRKPAKVKSPARKLKVPSWASGGNGNDVKLVGEEEHVCPYCLEEVRKGDRPGAVVCPECGTWHHQDCWNLTGSCGVAHRNEL